MSYLLRKVSFSKWEPNKEKCAANYSADAITGCTRTSNNTLSVWAANCIDFESNDCEDLIIAIASTMSRPDPIDLVWMEEKWLSEQGVRINTTLGDSKCISLNDKHKDLVAINHSSLAIVGEHILAKMKDKNTHLRVSKNKLIKLMIKKLNEGKIISFDDLNDKWRTELVKKM